MALLVCLTRRAPSVLLGDLAGLPDAPNPRGRAPKRDIQAQLRAAEKSAQERIGRPERTEDARAAPKSLWGRPLTVGTIGGGCANAVIPPRRSFEWRGKPSTSMCDTAPTTAGSKRLRRSSHANDANRLRPLRPGVLPAHGQVVHGLSWPDGGGLLPRDRGERDLLADDLTTLAIVSVHRPRVE